MEPLDEDGLRGTLAVKDVHHVAGSVALGEITVDHRWKRVFFKSELKDPIVAAKPFSANGGHPGVLRIRNVCSKSFDIRIQEWSYLDGWHYPERVGYIAVERGLQQLGPNEAGESMQVLAGSFRTDQMTFVRSDFAGWFPEAFSMQKTPVVLTSIVTYNGSDPVLGRLQNVDADGFDYRLQEEEAFKQVHTSENVHFIALTLGRTQVGDYRFVAGTAADVNQKFKSIPFDFDLPTAPVFLAEIQTTAGSDPVNIRWRAKSAKGIEVKLSEEKSLDAETNHWPEAVGYLTIGYTGPVCGDGECEEGEAGACAADCGCSDDDDCEPNEYCLYASCIVPSCGNGECEKGEVYQCSADCGAPFCGDGRCESEEIDSCPVDCGGGSILTGCSDDDGCEPDEYCASGSCVAL